MTSDFKKIKIVTDSVSDVPPALLEAWDITMIPCFVNFGGESYADDGVELVREDFYNKIEHMPDVPTTSAMSPDFAWEFIEQAARDADHLVILTTPAKLSGIYNSMRLATEKLSPGQFTLIDSGQISLGLAWQVMMAAQVAAETGSVEQTVQTIEAVRQNLKLYAMIDRLEFLRRSGRVGWAAAGVGTFLQIKPVIEVVDGEVTPFVRVRTRSRAMEKLVELAQEQAPVDKLAIAHINNPEAAQVLKEKLSGLVESEDDMLFTTIAPAVGVHTGPGTVGFATVRKGWRDAITTGNAG